MNHNKWEQVRYQVSTNSYVFVDSPEKDRPTKGLERIRIPLPEAPPSSFYNRVEYLAIDGIVIDMILLKDEKSYQEFNDKLDQYIKDVDVRKNYKYRG